MKVQLKFLAIIVLAGFIAVSCDDITPEPKSAEEAREDEPDDDDDDDDDDDEISFAQTIVPMLTNECSGCHDGSPSPDLTSNHYDNIVNEYIEPGDPEESILFSKVSDPSDNHYDYLDDDQREKLKQWIEEGAEDN